MTPVTDFLLDVRVLAHDLDLVHPELEDAVISAGVKLTVRSGRLTGYTVSGDNISPDVSNPNHWFLIGALTAKMFVGGEPDSFSSRVRPHSMSIGGRKNQLAELDEWITKANSGAMFSGWNSYLSWLEGISGVPSTWLHLTRLRISAPFDTITLSSSGYSAS